MQKVRIVTDTTADLPKEVAAEHDITVVPLIVNFGTETYLDRELDNDTFWEKATVIHPQSSQPPVGAFEEAFAPLVEASFDVICLTVTSKHSGTYNSAQLASQRFEGKVAVFDSWSLSWGLGLQALVAAQAAREGKGMAEILSMLEDARRRTHVVILLDTLDFLEKGGRAAKFINVVKRIVRAFNIKPILNLKEGELSLLGATNSYRRGVLRLEREVESLWPFERLAMFHTRNHVQAASFARTLAERFSLPVEDIPVSETGAVLSVHAGPGALAACVLASPKPE